jgi:prepilin-type N-terminal cleavage/methylation domain-containing protein
MNTRGFTFIELLVSMILLGVVSLAVYQLLTNNQRLYRQQAERSDLNATLRGATSILPMELREVNAADTMESDIRNMTPNSITYKAMRTLYFACNDPVDVGATGSIDLWQDPFFGGSFPNPARDSVVIFAEANPVTRMDNYWIHANVAAVTYGVLCPGGLPSVTVTLSGVSPSGGLADATAGAPVRGYEMLQVLTYQDARGDAWLGVRQFLKGSGWTTTQPLLGPLAGRGIEFTYLDTAGVTTTQPSQVARVGVLVPGMTREPVRAAGQLQRVIDTLSTTVAVRNNLGR